jgi:tetratricopeptide (TPR) repeat protein
MPIGKKISVSFDIRSILVFIMTICLAPLACTRAPVIPPTDAAPPPPPPERYENQDQALLKASLQGRRLNPREALELSDRLLAEGSSTSRDQETIARLELLLLGALKEEDRSSRAGLLRNLGIVRFHQRQYKSARQALQAANEINPRDARTHYYLARLFARQEQIYLRQGLKKKAKQQAKLAEMEMGLARKFEPSNALYRQNPKESLRPDQGN